MRHARCSPKLATGNCPEQPALQSRRQPAQHGALPAHSPISALHSRRGFSAVEMMLVTGLFCVVATMVTELFMNGANLYARAEARLDRQASALIALSTLSRQLRGSAAQTLTGTSSSQGMVACSFRRNAVPQIRPDSLATSPFVVFWHDPARRALCRMEIDRDTSFQRLTPLALTTCASKAGSAHCVAFLVRSLSIALKGSDGTELASFPTPLLRDPTITITATLSASTQQAPSPEDEVYSTPVVMRNKP